MSKTTETQNTELNLTAEVAQLSAELQKKLTVTADGTIEPDKKLYETLLPANITIDDIKRVQTFQTNLFSAAAHAVAVIGQEACKKNKKLDQVHMEALHLGKDKIRANYKRQTTVKGIGGVESVKHGWVTGKYTSASAGTGSAQFGRIRQHFAEQGATLFG